MHYIYSPAHCMAGLAQITPRIILTDSTPLFMRAPPLCSEGHNRATSKYPTHYPQSQFLALMKSPCQKGLAGGCESAILSHYGVLGSLHVPASFLSLPSSAVEPSPGSPCHGRACPQDEARSAEVPILKMADRVHRFRCSLQCELTFPQEWSRYHFLHALTHPLPFLRVFTPIDGQTYRMALAMALLCQYFPSPW